VAHGVAEFVPTRFLDADGDGYDISATELDWARARPEDLVEQCRITNPSASTLTGLLPEQRRPHLVLPVLHDRNGSIGYRLDWLDEGLSISSRRHKPSWRSSTRLRGDALDVLISEVVVDPEIWVERQSGLTEATARGSSPD